MADTFPLAGMWAASLALAGCCVEVLMPMALASDSPGRAVAEQPAVVGEPPLSLRLRGDQETPRPVVMKLDFPRLGAQSDAGRGGLPQALGGGPVVQSNHVPRYTLWSLDAGKQWCDGALAAFARPLGAVAEVAHEGSASEAAETLVDVPDATLRRAVEETLGKAPGDPITRGEMATLQVLSAESAVRQLAGIEYAINLRRLCVMAGGFSNLAPLAGMTSLEALFLSGNVSDLAPLAGLTSLTVLDLGGNAISDVAPLAGLRALTYLYLGNNGISDVAPLAGLPSLAYLDLYANGISDLSPLVALPSLTVLNLGNNAISDAAPLAGLRSLADLSLQHNGSLDLSSLAELPSVKTLILSGNGISDLSPLAGLKSLTRLYLADDAISDIAPLGELDSLTRLDLASSARPDLSPLTGLNSLTTLRLHYSGLVELGQLEGLQSLTELHLNDSAISASSRPVRIMTRRYDAWSPTT